MSDMPWKQQPVAPLEGSRIIKPVDTITIQIDNRSQPARVDMRTSTVMPIPLVINIFSNLISQLAAQMAQAMAANPQLNPSPNPSGNGDSR